MERTTTVHPKHTPGVATSYRVVMSGQLRGNRDTGGKVGRVARAAVTVLALAVAGKGGEKAPPYPKVRMALEREGEVGVSRPAGDCSVTLAHTPVPLKREASREKERVEGSVGGSNTSQALAPLEAVGGRANTTASPTVPIRAVTAFATSPALAVAERGALGTPPPTLNRKYPETLAVPTLATATLAVANDPVKDRVDTTAMAGGVLREGKDTFHRVPLTTTAGVGPPYPSATTL